MPLPNAFACQPRALSVAFTIAVALFAGTAEVSAQALDIDAPDITAGERELRSVNGFNGGWRAGSAGEPRNTNKISYAYSPVDWFRVVGHAEVANRISDDWHADHVALESFIALRKAPEESGIALSWYSSVQFALDDLGTSSFLFGPVIRIAMGKTSLTGNQLFEETFGQSAAPGINSLFGWQLKHELNDHVAIGAEWYGAIEDIGDTPSWREQDHRAGPTVYFSWDIDKGRKGGLDIGVFAGLTDAAPDVTLKVNFGIVH